MGITVKKIRLIAVVCFFIGLSPALRSQSVEKEFANLNNCIDIEMTALRILPDFYLKKQYDSIELALEFVKIKCFESEALRISSILLSIQNNVFRDSTISDRDIYLIKKEVKYIRQGHLYDFNHFLLSDLFSSSNFSRDFSTSYSRRNVEMKVIEMITRWSNELLLRSGLTSLENSLVEHIAGVRHEDRKSRNLFREVDRSIHNNSSIRNTYNRYHDNFLLNRAFYISTGYMHWVAGGNAQKVYGSLPGLYFKMGSGFSKKDRIDFYMGLRFGSAKQPVSIVRPDTSFTSNRATASLYGLDYVRSIWRPSRKLDISLLAGIGLEQRSLFKSQYDDPEVDNEPADLINAKTGESIVGKFYGSVGSEINYFIAPAFAINTGIRYLFSNNFKNSIAATPIGGNSLLIQVGISAFINGHPARRRGFWNLMR